MKKNYRLLINTLFVLIIFSNYSVAATIIPSGNVNGKWTLTGSPYNIEGDITVSGADSLTIEAGVVVNFSGTYGMNVYGYLSAIGSVSDSVVFMPADTASGWRGLYIAGMESNCTMQYCKLQYVKSKVAVYCNFNSGANISNSLLSNNTVEQGSVLKVIEGYLFVDKCKIINNSGAAVFVNYCSASLFNNIISNNSGDGIVFTEAGGRVHDNVISNNAGNGISCTAESYVYVNYNTIANNKGKGISYGRGGGIANHNVIANNSGGGIYCDKYYLGLTITNSTIVNNKAVTGGALNCRGGSSPEFHNCIIWGNTSGSGGGQIFIKDESHEFSNIPNSPEFYYCNIQGGLSGFDLDGIAFTGIYQNNIDSVPQFIAPSSGAGSDYNGVAADWSLQSSSPCIDKGNPNQTYEAIDKAGNPRVRNCIIDIGAYEYQSVSSFMVSISQTQNIVCHGDSSASVSAYITGGVAPYSYIWSTIPAQTNPIATGLSAGVYTVEVTDKNGCTATNKITVNEPTLLIANAGENKVVYYGYPPMACAVLKGLATGGTPPYKYHWSNGINNAYTIVCPKTTQQYILTITDANGCIATDVTKVCVINVQAPQGKNLIQICHKNKNGTFSTINVPFFIAPLYLAKGDVLGKCGTITSCNDDDSIRGMNLEEEENPIVIDNANLTSYPNPFSFETTIRFSTITSEQVEVSVFNIMGEKVAILFNGNVEAEEVNEVKFNATSLSDGVYFVKMITQNGELKVEKVVLNK